VSVHHPTITLPAVGVLNKVLDINLEIGYNKGMKLKEYLLKEEEKLGRLSIFDIDDTLFHTTAQIAVVKDGKKIKKLTNQEFNTYKLAAGESFDFSEFKDAAKFYKESEPISKMLNAATKLISATDKNPENKVIIVTARANFDNREKFLSTFRRHGIDIDKVHVERAGNMTLNNLPNLPAVKKAIIISQYLKTNKYSRVSLFDDSMDNLKEFLKLRSKFVMVRFNAYLVLPSGQIKLVK
jgi:hypothetical protein